MPNLFGAEVSQDTYELNKHMVGVKEPKSDARINLGTELRKQFALSFEANWRLLGGPELEKEFQFCPERQWRADYLVSSTMWLIELEGGVYQKGNDGKQGGRHQRPSGFVEDCFKYNQAALLGYRLIRIATGMATPQYLRQIIEGLKS